MENQLTPKEIEAMVRRILADALDMAADTIRGRKVERFEASAPPGIYMAPKDIGGRTLGDAVVDAVNARGGAVTARAVLAGVADHPMIAGEPDDRYKARKVSQALYSQRKTRLRSVKVGTTTWWVMPEWLDKNGKIAAERFDEPEPPEDVR